MGRYEGVREKRRHVRVTTLLFRNGVNGSNGEGRAKRLMVNLGLSHRSISTEYNTFIGRSGDGKRGRGGATRESGTHYGGSGCNRLANLGLASASGGNGR